MCVSAKLLGISQNDTQMEPTCRCICSLGSKKLRFVYTIVLFFVTERTFFETLLPAEQTLGEVIIFLASMVISSKVQWRI